MSRAKILTVIMGSGLIVLVVLSEVLSSTRNGIGPYQFVLLLMGIGIVLVGLLSTDNWAGKVVLMLMSVLVTLILIEGMLAILNRLSVDVTYPDVRELQDDDLLGKRTPANASGHDERGWRNTVALEQANIVAIGDSQTWGVNASLALTYPSVLADLTGQTVYSMAQGSYGAVQYRVLAEQAIELSPQLVIVGMYFGNDLADAYTIVYGDYAHTDLRDPEFDFTAISQTISEQAQNLQPSNLVTATLPEPTRDLTLLEQMQSGTFIGKLLTNAGIFSVIDTGGASRQLEVNRELVKNYPDLLSYYQQGEIETFLTPAYRQFVIDVETPMIAEGLRITKSQYVDIASMLAEENIELLVVLIPTKEFVYLPYITDEDMKPVYQQLGEQEQAIRDDMMMLFDDKGIAYVDTLPALRDAVKNNVAIYPATFDGHPNVNGYRVIAETIAEYVESY